MDNRRYRAQHLFRTVILAFFIVTGLIVLAGCTPGKYDLSDTVQTVQDNEEQIMTVFKTAESVLTDEWVYINPVMEYDDDDEHLGQCYRGRMDGEEYISEYLDPDDPDISYMTDYLVKNDSGIGKTEQGMEIFQSTGNDSIGILLSDRSLDELECPYQDSDDGTGGYEPYTLEWEKHMDGDNLVFICDRRDDETTFFQGMYYRIDIRQATDNIYVYHITSAAPFINTLMSV